MGVWLGDRARQSHRARFRHSWSWNGGAVTAASGDAWSSRRVQSILTRFPRPSRGKFTMTQQMTGSEGNVLGYGVVGDVDTDGHVQLVPKVEATVRFHRAMGLLGVERLQEGED